MKMLNDNTIAIYVILDDILQEIAHKASSQRRVNDSMVLTIVLISSCLRYFFLMAVCHNIRISRCRLLKGEDFRGRNTSGA